MKRKKNKGPKKSQYTRKRIWINNNGICWICKNKVQFELMTLDHVIPVSKGGKNYIENLRPSHWKCNSERKDEICDEFEFALVNIMCHVAERCINEIDNKIRKWSGETFKETELKFDKLHKKFSTIV